MTFKCKKGEKATDEAADFEMKRDRLDHKSLRPFQRVALEQK